MSSGAVLHLSPHPDDELIGPPATLMQLRDEGYRIVNLACSLGRSEPDRRSSELEEALARARFEGLVAENQIYLPNGGYAVDALAQEVTTLIGAISPIAVISPSLFDRHPAHEAVASAARMALAQTEPNHRPRWWTWHLWGEMIWPNIGVQFDRERLDEIIYCLGAHGGELERNDYTALVTGRAMSARVLGPELLFGFGSKGSNKYAEILNEVVWDRSWKLGRSRWLDSSNLLDPPTSIDVTSRLDKASDYSTIGRPESRR